MKNILSINELYHMCLSFRLCTRLLCNPFYLPNSSCLVGIVNKTYTWASSKNFSHDFPQTVRELSFLFRYKHACNVPSPVPWWASAKASSYSINRASHKNIIKYWMVLDVAQRCGNKNNMWTQKIQWHQNPKSALVFWVCHSFLLRNVSLFAPYMSSRCIKGKIFFTIRLTVWPRSNHPCKLSQFKQHNKGNWSPEPSRFQQKQSTHDVPRHGIISCLQSHFAQTSSHVFNQVDHLVRLPEKNMGININKGIKSRCQWAHKSDRFHAKKGIKGFTVEVQANL